MDLQKMLKAVLTKKAKGYSAKEKTEEYILSDGQLLLNKKKVVTKHVPPDINAVKALFELSNVSNNDVSEMNDQQLEVEKLRLLSMLDVCGKYSQQTEELKQEENFEND